MRRCDPSGNRPQPHVHMWETLVPTRTHPFPPVSTIGALRGEVSRRYCAACSVQTAVF